ncbi:hypothetical protein SERLA73DRAFT_80637 [Serpula lacrymans var. lacrymans S7.3]|uniref:Uncharacterized protein n=1 Tax=Serpula lacrymans var. lacrymans (strain S7.3) TaxID=936435 RepID=F8QK28_SERL3|nr:hypothetical protein SERLA73DRAFT_80637 [Serpula lacrymans var. lacrymans S7.3]
MGPYHSSMIGHSHAVVITIGSSLESSLFLRITWADSHAVIRSPRHLNNKGRNHWLISDGNMGPVDG